MGADGGINWVRVTGDKKEFDQLVRPLGLLWEGSSYYDQYHYDYLERNPLPNDYEVSRYGSFDKNAGLDDLKDIIDELDYYSKNPKEFDWSQTDPLNLTWVDLLAEYHTGHWKDCYSGTWSLPAFMRVIVEEYNTFFDKENFCIKHFDHPSLHMTLGDWYSRVINLIDRKSFGSEETWT